MTNDDDTPIIHRILNRNDVHRVVAANVSLLLTMADPELVREALADALGNWAKHVETCEALAELATSRDPQASVRTRGIRVFPRRGE